MASAQVDGLSKTVKALKAKSVRGGVKGEVEVGYATFYATYVHENTQAIHPVGQAKFLEQPARNSQVKRRQNEAFKTVLSKTNSLKEALRASGLVLLEASKPLVPVDTGLLQRSGYVFVR